jgi:hypothetical protein
MVLNALRRWRLRAALRVSWIWCSRTGSAALHMHANILKRRPLCTKVGVVMRWHHMRHFAVSL